MEPHVCEDSSAPAHAALGLQALQKCLLLVLIFNKIFSASITVLLFHFQQFIFDSGASLHEHYL